MKTLKLRPELPAKTGLALLLLVALGAALYFERSASSPSRRQTAVCAVCGHGCKDEFERKPELFTATQ
jgi:anaerobic selenocysteine-containing dehydrogenase